VNYSYSAMFNRLRSNMNQHFLKRNFCNLSSHYEIIDDLHYKRKPLWATNKSALCCQQRQMGYKGGCWWVHEELHILWYAKTPLGLGQHWMVQNQIFVNGMLVWRYQSHIRHPPFPTTQLRSNAYRSLPGGQIFFSLLFSCIYIQEL